MEPKGTGDIHVVISIGKEISSITRAAIAGLNTFCPNPPYNCLEMMTANKLPNTAIHQGAHGGSDKASSHAVSRPEPSISTGRTLRSCQRTISASPSKAASNDTAHRLIAGQPYNQKPNSVAGASATITSRITLLMVKGTWAWGECAICVI